MFFCIPSYFFSYTRSEVNFITIVEASDSNSIDVPKLYYPSTDNEFITNDLTPLFIWTKSKNASGYNVVIQKIIDQKTEVIFDSDDHSVIRYNQFRIPNSVLKADVNYSIKIRAISSLGNSNYSKQSFFTIKENELFNRVKVKTVRNVEQKLPPVIISKNNLIIKTEKNKDQNYSLSWNKNSELNEFQLIIEGINASKIFGDEYFSIVDTIISDTVYNINPNNLKGYNNYRWKLRNKSFEEWGEYTEYYYFSIVKDESIKLEDSSVDELILRFKYSSIIDEMLVAKYKSDVVYLPFLEFLSLIQVQNVFDSEDKVITVTSLYESENQNSVNLTDEEISVNGVSNQITKNDFIVGDIDYFLKKDIIEKVIGATIDINLRDMSLKFSSKKELPMVERLINEKKVSNLKASYIDNEFPLVFDRSRNDFAPGFFDYALTGNFVKEEQPYYFFNMGLGSELFGGDAQVFSQYSIFQNKLLFNQTDYRWRYAFLNNRKISSVSLGNNSAQGLQSYEFRGVSVSNEPLESRRYFGKRVLEEATNPFWKIEVYHNNTLVDIVQADEKGNYQFYLPFSYGTTQVELRQYGLNGETKLERKMYQIPNAQLPTDQWDYSINFGQLISVDENLVQTSAAYGVNDWLTAEIGTDVFTNDFNNSSLYAKTRVRYLEGYNTNLTIAPNAFYEFELNSVFSDLANFNVATKIFEENSKLNPTKIKSEIDGNLFLPFTINDNLLSMLVSGQRLEFENFKRYDLSLRAFYNYKNFSPSIEYDYYSIVSQNSFSNSFLHFRLNYSFYIPSSIIGGNILDSRLIYNMNSNKAESFNIILATTILEDYRIQISHNINFSNSFSDTQLRIVFDLPFLRSNTNISKSVFSQSILGSINYNRIMDEWDFHNRGMVGKSAAAVRFFLDQNDNRIFDKNEPEINNMDVSINSIGTKRINNNGSLTITDLEPYAKYDLKLVDKKSKNPIWFPSIQKFSFISDPNHFKEISIPFYEAAVVTGIVFKEIENQRLPISGLTIYLKKVNSEEPITVKTMSDGSFYKYGIEPGAYEIFIDETQLERIKLKSFPEKIETKVYSINSENNNDDFEFVLK